LLTALGGFIHFLIALSVVLITVWFLHGFGNVLVLSVLVPNLILLFAFAWCLAILAGFATVYFQDTQHLCEVGFQILLYATPIIYKADMLRGNNLGWLVDCNPLVSVLQLVREPILEGTVPTLQTFAVATLTVFTVAGAASLM